MRFRTALAGVTGAIGLTAVGNRLIERRTRPLQPALPGVDRTFHWRGMDVAYAEVGDPDGPDLVLFHGIHAAASNREFAAIVDALAERYHLLVPDLPGFGRSDRPPLLYSGALYTAFVSAFLEELADDEPRCLATSLSGAYLAEVAERSSVGPLVLICPTATTTGIRQSFVRSAYRSPLLGTAVHNLVASRRSIEYYYRDFAVEDPDAIDPDDLAYLWQTSHQPGAKFPVASFLAGYLDRPIDLGESLRAVEAPVTLLWGRSATLPPLSVGRGLAERADAGLVVVDRARVLPHVEHPGRVADAIRSALEP